MPCDAPVTTTTFCDVLMLYPENFCSASTRIGSTAPIKANVDTLIPVLHKSAINPF
jgi:hypothetical protein